MRKPYGPTGSFGSRMNGSAAPRARPSPNRGPSAAPTSKENNIMWDRLLRNARVVDPVNGRDGVMDVAVKGRAALRPWDRRFRAKLPKSKTSPGLC